MDDTIFTGAFSSSMNEIMLELLENLIAESQANASSDSTQTGNTSYASGSSTGQTSKFADLVEQASQKYGVQPELVDAVIQAESNFNPSAISSAGAEGLMQLMPGTAKGLGVTDAMDPSQNINGGTKFLKSLLDRYDGNVQLALAAYNAGSGAVDSYNGIPPYQETQTYVQRVMDIYKSNLEEKG